MYIHMWSASSSESIALLSDAESDSCFGLSEDPLVFDREPANLKTRSRAGLAGPRGPHKPVRSFPSFRFQAARRPAGPPAKCRARAGTDRPAPLNRPPLLQPFKGGGGRVPSGCVVPSLKLLSQFQNRPACGG